MEISRMLLFKEFRYPLSGDEGTYQDHSGRSSGVRDYVSSLSVSVFCPVHPSSSEDNEFYRDPLSLTTPHIW